MTTKKIDQTLTALIPERRSSTDWVAGVRRRRARGRIVGAAAAVAAVTTVGVLAFNLLPTRHTTPVPAQPAVTLTGDDYVAARQECAQSSGIDPDTLRVRSVTNTQEGIISNVVESGGNTYSCLWAKEGEVVTSGSGWVNPAPWADPDTRAAGRYYVETPSVVWRSGGSTLTVAVVTGRLPAEAATIRFGEPISIDIVVSGHQSYHHVHPFDGEVAVDPVTPYQILGATGEVLFDSSAGGDTNVDAVLSACLDGLVGADRLSETPDDATVHSPASLDGFTFGLIRAGDQQYPCGVDPHGTSFIIAGPFELVGDDGVTRWDPWPGYEVSAQGALGDGSWYHFVGGGDLPSDAATVEFPDATASSVTLGEDGVFTFVARTNSSPASSDLTYVVRDANGAELARGTAWGEGAPQR